MRDSSTCYMCDWASVSREHVPPRCLFPEAALAGRDVRQNLITVPACAAHNSAKSKDDEFLRALLILMTGSQSEMARLQFQHGLLRAVDHAPEAHRRFTKPTGLRKANKVLVESEGGRFDRCMRHIAHGLFFNAFNRKWRCRIAIASPFITAPVEHGDPFVLDSGLVAAVAATRSELAACADQGSNPEVFQYRLRYEEPENLFMFSLLFYGVVDVYGYSSDVIDREYETAPPGVD